VEPLHQRGLAHDLPGGEVVADTNYSNGLNYALLEARGGTPWLPVFGQYRPELAGFTYEQATACFACPAGKPLPAQARLCPQEHDAQADAHGLRHALAPGAGPPAAEAARPGQAPAAAAPGATRGGQLAPALRYAPGQHKRPQQRP